MLYSFRTIDAIEVGNNWCVHWDAFTRELLEIKIKESGLTIKWNDKSWFTKELKSIKHRETLWK